MDPYPYDSYLTEFIIDLIFPHAFIRSKHLLPKNSLQVIMRNLNRRILLVIMLSLILQMMNSTRYMP